jgi:hypothetical protein
MGIAGSARSFCWIVKGAQAGMPFEAQGEPVPLWGLMSVMRGLERSAGAGSAGVSAKAQARKPAVGPGHRPIRVCRVQNCEKPGEAATRGRSGARRCDYRISPDDGTHDGWGFCGFCEQRSPNLRVVRGPRGEGLGCKAEVRRRGGRRSRWGRRVRRSARRFRRGRRIRSVRADDRRRARWRRGNREYAVCRAAVSRVLYVLLTFGEIRMKTPRAWAGSVSKKGAQSAEARYAVMPAL